MSFQSNHEFFDYVLSLTNSLARDGRGPAATMLNEGLASINGLTDGWATFLESVENVQNAYGRELTAIDANRLEKIRNTAYAVVHRG